MPVRPDIGNVSGGQATPKEPSAGTSNQTPINRSVPKPQSRVQKSRTGNMRMRRSTITNSQPVVKSLHPTPPPQHKPAVDTPTPEQPINRSPNAASGSGGLDDLFGFGNQEGRMRIPRATKTTSAQSPSSSTLLREQVLHQPIQNQNLLPQKVSPPPKPINRSPNAASGSGGLDDLFGFGNQEGRMRLPRSNPKEPVRKKPRPIYGKNPVQKPTDGTSEPKSKV